VKRLGKKILVYALPWLPLLLLLPGAAGLEASVEFVDVEKDGDTWLLKPGSEGLLIIRYQKEKGDVFPRRYLSGMDANLQGIICAMLTLSHPGNSPN
jgi:hypothetical protein